MKCPNPKCGYLNKSDGKCAICDYQMTPEKEEKVYVMPRQSVKQKEIKAKDLIYYKQCFEYSHKVCEECNLQLGEKWDPYFVAHIITKKGDCPERWDTRNHVILCPEHHDQFDSKSRSKMKIYAETERVRQELNHEYYSK
jgi:hypothetical protein